MQRTDRILKYANVSGKGIEVAPYFNPIVAKRDGHDVLIMDVFDTETLRAGAQEDPNIPDARVSEIEDIDLVGDASRIGEITGAAGLHGKIDYILSSHNFEHLPNPILFLQGVYDTLAPGGVISMAIPDYRACFDHFRMPTRLSDWLAAYKEDRTQPSPETVFDGCANKARFMRDGEATVGCNLTRDDPRGFIPEKALIRAYEDYAQSETLQQAYNDAHCSLVFPETFELFLTDLRKLGLIKLDIEEISETMGMEFFVHLRKPEEFVEVPDDTFYENRHRLLVEVSKNLGAAPFGTTPWSVKIRPYRVWLIKLRLRLKHYFSGR